MYQFPALATLIYVDWLPTGQWFAVNPTVSRRGSQMILCQQSYRRRWFKPKHFRNPFGVSPVMIFVTDWMMYAAESALHHLDYHS